MPIVRLESAIFRLLDACLIEECLIIDEFLLKERFEPMISVAARITAPVAGMFKFKPPICNKISYPYIYHFLSILQLKYRENFVTPKTLFSVSWCCKNQEISISFSI